LPSCRNPTSYELKLLDNDKSRRGTFKLPEIEVTIKLPDNYKLPEIPSSQKLNMLP
jgi:hypothetical protein